ncbi:MAG: GntR family transcriptional regulator [Chloroflexota bacterium]|nr:GntR family transcriptional regulator [Chloroflexota bacterium]
MSLTNNFNDKRLRAAVPLYIQIAESLLDRITSGELAPEERLQSERDLSQSLNVSRMTLRAALRVLDNKGMLVRRPGDGTYIAKPKIERQAAKLVSFTDGMRSRGYQASAQLIVFERKLAEVSIASKLQVPVSAPVYYFQRLRLINQEPVLLETCTIPIYRFPNLEEYDLEKRSIIEIMETEYGIAPHHSEQSLEAVSATDYEAELLNIEAGTPLMLERRLAFDKDDSPLEHGHDLYRGDRFRFITEIAPLQP